MHLYNNIHSESCPAWVTISAFGSFPYYSILRSIYPSWWQYPPHISGDGQDTKPGDGNQDWGEKGYNIWVYFMIITASFTCKSRRGCDIDNLSFKIHFQWIFLCKHKITNLYIKLVSEQKPHRKMKWNKSFASNFMWAHIQRFFLLHFRCIPPSLIFRVNCASEIIIPTLVS